MRPKPLVMFVVLMLFGIGTSLRAACRERNGPWEGSREGVTLLLHNCGPKSPLEGYSVN